MRVKFWRLTITDRVQQIHACVRHNGCKTEQKQSKGKRKIWQNKEGINKASNKGNKAKHKGKVHQKTEDKQQQQQQQKENKVN